MMKILVVKLSSFGDTLHALPAVAALKQHYGAEVHWAVQPNFASIVRCFACVDKVIEIPRPSKLKEYFKALNAIHKSDEYDMVIDFQGLMKSALVARAARSKKRIGPSFAREGSPLFYHALAGKRNKNRHAIEECYDILSYLGISIPLEPKYPLTLPQYDLQYDDSTEAKLHIAIAPKSRWETKDWPIDRFALLAERLERELDAIVYVIGGPGEKELGNKIIASTKQGVNLCGVTSIPQTMSVLKQMDILVSNDSGPMHMGVATGVPVIVPFGPTSPERTGPFGSSNIVVQTNVCPPCRKRVCPKGTMECMSSISVDMVYDAIRSMLERLGKI